MTEIKRSVFLDRPDLFGQRRVLVKLNGEDRTKEPIALGTLGPDNSLILNKSARKYREQIRADVQVLLLRRG